jgi:hypothetical protein
MSTRRTPTRRPVKIAYLCFDMDETLGSFTIMDSFLPIFLGADSAYEDLVSTVGEYEKTNQLGIFRPDLYQFLEKTAQRYGTAHISIYSNNADTDLVHFVADVLRYWGRDLPHLHFCFAYDRLHEARFPADTGRGPYPLKTFKTVVDGYKASGCVGKDVNIPKESIYFFDDLKHEDLKRALGRHYIRVKAYEPTITRRYLWDAVISPLIDRYGLVWDKTVPRGKAASPTQSPHSYSALQWLKGGLVGGSSGSLIKTRKHSRR